MIVVSDGQTINPEEDPDALTTELRHTVFSDVTAIAVNHGDPTPSVYSRLLTDNNPSPSNGTHVLQEPSTIVYMDCLAETDVAYASAEQVAKDVQYQLAALPCLTTPTTSGTTSQSTTETTTTSPTSTPRSSTATLTPVTTRTTSPTSSGTSSQTSSRTTSQTTTPTTTYTTSQTTHECYPIADVLFVRLLWPAVFRN